MIKALIDIIVGGGTYLKRERVTRIGDGTVSQRPATASELLEPPVKPERK